MDLQDLVSRTGVDVVMVQESKLLGQMSTPQLDGFTAIRRDRQDGNIGGGLVTYVSRKLAFDFQEAEQRCTPPGGCETLCLKLKVGPRRWLRLMNCYEPPRRTGAPNEAPAATDGSCGLEGLPFDSSTFIGGDLNAHSPLWDAEQPADARGEAIEDWLMRHDAACVNDGSPTRINPATGGLSSPDVSICHPSWLARCQWMPLDELGSDHRPILWTVAVAAEGLLPVEAHRSKWRRNGVDFSGFALAVEAAIPLLDTSLPLSQRVADFNAALHKAGEAHVGRTKVGKRTRSWMTPEVREATKVRNRLRRAGAPARREWVEACRKTHELTVEAKQRCWAAYVEDAERSKDAATCWKVVRGLSGSPDGNAPNESLRHNGRTFSSPVGKAALFAQHYAAVSRLSFSKEERVINRNCKEALRAVGPDTEAACDLTAAELDAAIDQMRAASAAGPDDIPATFLKALGPLARYHLLQIFNESWRSGFVPQCWRNATIIPILKSKKPASQLSSFRPVSLTSCVAKTLERIVNRRLYHLAETSGWLSPEQAGFRRLHSCEDQVIRVVQSISDAFQQTPAQRSVAVLLDFSKAYDRVWRQRLLLDLATLGAPLVLCRWLRGFLENRQAAVSFAGATCRMRPFRQGLPQGSVLAPLLFAIYIDPLRRCVPDGVNVAMYADDVTVWASSRRKAEAANKVQHAVDCVAAWSASRKMLLSRDKSVSAFFSTDSHEANWVPPLVLEGTILPHCRAPSLLGVKLDRTLSFREHVEEVVKKAASRCSILRALASSAWGWQKSSVRQIYLSIVRSGLDFAAAAWQPFLAPSSLARLETAQNRGLRAITGQLRTTPVEALRLEAGVCSYATTSRRLVTTAYEKALRLPANHPRRVAACPVSPVRHRLVRSSWRARALADEHRAVLDSAGDREPLPRPGFSEPAPWHLGGVGGARRWHVAAALPGTGKDTSEETRRRLAAECIDGVGANIVIYTDGSAGDGMRDGGAAAVVTTGPAASPVVLEVLRDVGAPLTSSFEEEVRALSLAVRWLVEHDPGGQSLVCSDSQSALLALRSGAPSLHGVRSALQCAKGLTTLQWVPSHCGLPGNEAADGAAGEARYVPEEGHGAPISYASAKSFIRRSIKDKDPSHARTAAVYAAIDQMRDAQQLSSRAEAVRLARIRSGHHLGFRAYSRLINPTVNPVCSRCGEAEHCLEHWLQECPALAARRMEIFGDSRPPLSVLTTEPGAAVLMSRRL
jgi:ribonuclease HI